MPFDVTFHINAHDSDAYIVSCNFRYRQWWRSEFTGNGSELPRMIDYIYIIAGNYIAKLIVINNNRNMNESTIAITVLKPEKNSSPTCSILTNVTLAMPLSRFHLLPMHRMMATSRVIHGILVMK